MTVWSSVSRRGPAWLSGGKRSKHRSCSHCCSDGLGYSYEPPDDEDFRLDAMYDRKRERAYYFHQTR